jgi:hypothetical protein
MRGIPTIMQKTAKPVKKSKTLGSGKKLEKKVPLNSFTTLTTKIGPVGKI